MDSRDAARDLRENVHQFAIEMARIAQVLLDHDARLTDHAEHAEATDEIVADVRTQVNEIEKSLAKIEGHADAERERNQHETPLKAAGITVLGAILVALLVFGLSFIHHP